MRYRFFAAFAVSPLLIASSLLAMGGSYGKGNPKSPISSSGWSAELVELVNREDRIGGSWVNQFDSFDYAGTAADFNAFVQKFAMLNEGPHIVTLLQQTDPATEPAGASCDWHLSINGHWNKAPTSVGLTLVVGRRIKLADVVLPKGITIAPVDNPSPEIQAYLKTIARSSDAPTTRPSDTPRK